MKNTIASGKSSVSEAEAGLLREAVEVLRRKGIVYLDPLRAFLGVFLDEGSFCKHYYIEMNENILRRTYERKAEIGVLQSIFEERLAVNVRKVSDNYEDILDFINQRSLPLSEENDGA